jgi:diguanylate cyclase (GGDEF)-like protein
VSTPSEYAADKAIEVDTQPGRPDQRAISGRIWFARILGLVLLAGALAVLAIAGSSFAVSSIVLVLFAAYVFLSERHARRLTLSMEKRLRLSLLVHNMELENMAMQDDLTQMFNRRYFFERLEREIETSRAFKRPLSLMVVDLDGMKAVNDGYGHRVGDELLAAFGQFLLSATRASDVPARTGGDEFAIILPDTSEQAAVALKNRLARKLAETPLLEGDVVVHATASFGVATFPAAGDTVDAVLQRADIDMYADKNMRRIERDKATAKAS